MTFDPKWQPPVTLGSVSDWKGYTYIVKSNTLHMIKQDTSMINISNNQVLQTGFLDCEGSDDILATLHPLKGKHTSNTYPQIDLVCL